MESLGEEGCGNLDLPHFRGQFLACDFLFATVVPFKVDG